MREPDYVDEYYADKDLSLLKKLTLVIPTFNRNYYLSRCLWYHAHFPFGEIIVADSSPEEKKVVNRETVAKVREMFGANVRYLEYEPETEKYGGDIYRKWGDAVQHVETEYSQIVTDKEFLIPETLTNLISLLAENKNIIVCEGVLCTVHRDSKHNLRCVQWQSSGSAKSHNLRTRFEQTIQNNVCPLLGLYRSKDHKYIYEQYLGSNINDLRFGEAYLELKALICGSYARIPNLIHTLRDVTKNKDENGNLIIQESSTILYPSIWSYPPDYFQIKFNQFQKQLMIDIINQEQYPSEIVKRWLTIHSKRYLKHRFTKIDYYLKNTIVGKIWRNCPTHIKRYLIHVRGVNFKKSKIYDLESYNTQVEVIYNIIKNHDK